VVAVPCDRIYRGVSDLGADAAIGLAQNAGIRPGGRDTQGNNDATLLCVLLREELRRFEEEDLHSQRCVVEAAALFDQWITFLPRQNDEVRQRREFSQTLTKLGELGFVSRFSKSSDEPETRETRRILKARLPVAEPESLKNQLVGALARQAADKAADARIKLKRLYPSIQVG
jgi:hypothetical protein